MDFEFVQLDGDAFAFQYKRDGQMLAEITWTMLGDVMAVDHTFVSPELRGGGIAKQLLDRAAVYAREQAYKMEPICSYVITAFERYDDYNDIKL